ncbi:MAG: hypothetical protein ABI900_01690 [Betaproteobacteria bacterium]
MISASLIRAPDLSLRCIPVWRHNPPVWRKLAMLSGRIPDGIPLHIAVLLSYAVAAYYVALVLTRRLLK